MKKLMVSVLLVCVIGLGGCPFAIQDNQNPPADPPVNTPNPPDEVKTGSLELVLFGQKSLSDPAVAAIVERLKGQACAVRATLKSGYDEIIRDENIIVGQPMVTFPGIPVGAWDVKVELFNFQSKIFDGASTAVIVAGLPTTVSIDLAVTEYNFQFYVYNLRGNFGTDGQFGCLDATFGLAGGGEMPIEPFIYGFGNGAYSCWFKIELPLSTDYGLLTLTDYDGQPVQVELNFDWFVLNSSGGTVYVDGQEYGDLVIQISLPVTGAASWKLDELPGGSSQMLIDIGTQSIEQMFDGVTASDPMAKLIIQFYWRGEWAECTIDAFQGFPIGVMFAFVPERVSFNYQTVSDVAANSRRIADWREWLAYYNGRLLEDADPACCVWQLADQFIYDSGGAYYWSLQDAVNYSSYSDIYVGEGSYTGFIMPAGRNISIHGLQAHKSWLINPGGRSQVVYASAMGGPYSQKGGGSSLTLENLGIYNGFGQTDMSYSDAAIFIEGGIGLNMLNCVVQSRSNKCVSLNYQSAYLHHCVFIGSLQQFCGIASYHGYLMVDTSVAMGFSEAFHIENTTPQSKLNCLDSCAAVSNDGSFPTAGYIYAYPQLGANYVATAGSPCINAAGPGIDIGLDYAPPF